MSSNYLSQDYTFTPNVDAYLERIDYHGSRDLTIDTLRGIHWQHLLTVPFEDIDVHLTGEISLDPVKLEQKLVHNRRGGYCFENNIYAMWILRALGFKVTPVLARTRWQNPVDVVNPATHIVLKVELDGVLWMYDVGFSSMGTPWPLEIETDREQTTPLETRRVIKEETGYVQQILLSGEWKDIFIFTLRESYPMDWEVGSYFVYKAPFSRMVINLFVSMPTKDRRYLLFNKTLTTRFLDGTSEVREIATNEEYLQVLKECFQLTFPPETVFTSKLVKW